MTLTFIYSLCDPRTGEVRYVGKADHINKRLEEHRFDARHISTHKANWLKSLLRENLEPSVVILETAPSDGWQEREQWWIAHYREQGARLVNGTDGGDGTTGYTHSLEARARMSEMHRGRVHLPETRAKMAAAKKGHIVTKETRAKMSAAAKGNTNSKGHIHSPETRAKIGAASKGRIPARETRAKMSATKKGRAVSPETRAKLSAAVKIYWARKHTENQQERGVKSNAINQAEQAR